MIFRNKLNDAACVLKILFIFFSMLRSRTVYNKHSFSEEPQYWKARDK